MKAELLISNSQQIRTGRVGDAIVRATKEGIFEFVFEMVKADPIFVFSHDTESSNIFPAAVQYRRAKIFGLIYGFNMKSEIGRAHVWTPVTS